MLCDPIKRETPVPGVDGTLQNNAIADRHERTKIRGFDMNMRRIVIFEVHPYLKAAARPDGLHRSIASLKPHDS